MRFGFRSDAEDPVLDACLLHCINHCSKTAELIKKSDQQAKADDGFEPPRDQGFTRPKVCVKLAELFNTGMPLFARVCPSRLSTFVCMIWQLRLRLLCHWGALVSILVHICMLACAY